MKRIRIHLPALVILAKAGIHTAHAFQQLGLSMDPRVREDDGSAAKGWMTALQLMEMVGGECMKRT